MRLAVRRLLFAQLLMLFAAAPAFSQALAVSTVRVNALRPLEFGSLIGGLDGSVAPDGLAFSGQFEVLGPPGAMVQLIFTLPLELSGDKGSRLQVTFSAQSAAYSLSQSGRDLIPFDPRSPFSVVMPPAGRITVMIGGAAHPGQQAVTGHYTGNLSLLARIQ